MKSPSFKEFAVKLPKPVADMNKKLLSEGIIGGIDLGKDYPELKGHLLISITDMTKKAEIDRLVSSLS